MFTLNITRKSVKTNVHDLTQGQAGIRPTDHTVWFKPLGKAVYMLCVTKDGNMYAYLQASEIPAFGNDLYLCTLSINAEEI